MLISSARVLGVPVLSLHVCGPIATTSEAIIDPDNLKIVAFLVDKVRPDEETGDILRARDIREFSNMGMVVDSEDEFVSREDIVWLDKLMRLNFDLIGFKVETKSGTNLGKVIDYTLNPNDLTVQQLIVKRPFFKAFIDPELVVGRGEIVEINNSAIVVKEEKEKPRATAPSGATRDFVNPFREMATKPAATTETSNKTTD